MYDEFASVLLVNFNGAQHLPVCLTALQQQSVPRGRFEVILVDNASTDGSVELIRSQFPWVRLVTLHHNVGFAEGTNIASHHAHGAIQILLNNDTIPDPYWLEELTRALHSNPDLRAASKLVFAHDATVLNSTGLFLLRDSRGADRGFRQVDRGQFEVCEPVFAGCGAATAVPAPFGQETLLDSNYFLYYEDLDSGWRAQLANRSTVYAPRSLVCHVHGAAAGASSLVFHFHVERNRALTAWREGDLVLAGWSAAVLFVKAIFASIRSIRQPQSRPVARAVTRATVSFLSHLPRVLFERITFRLQPAPEAIRCGS